MDPIHTLEPASVRTNAYRKRRRPKRYDRFGEVIRYLTIDEIQQLFDGIDNYTHKLMFEVIYELGCRVGEFVKMKVRHISFSRSTVFFPAENTKTRFARTSSLPQGLTNELKSLLKQNGAIGKRDDRITKPDGYVFHPGKRWNTSYTENRLRQIFQRYVTKTGLQQTYGQDRCGKSLKMFTVHSLRHSHIMHYVVDRGLPLPIVQKQVGHRSLKTTSMYLSASTEKMAQAYRTARQRGDDSSRPTHAGMPVRPGACES
jgi:integrase